MYIYICRDPYIYIYIYIHIYIHILYISIISFRDYAPGVGSLVNTSPAAMDLLSRCRLKFNSAPIIEETMISYPMTDPAGAGRKMLT